MLALIYSPAKSAMQSGQAGSGGWRLRFLPQKPKWIEPLMGCTSSADMQAEVTLRFDTKQEAVAFAEKNGLAYQLAEPQKPLRQKKCYADNFRFDRKQPWTH